MAPNLNSNYNEEMNVIVRINASGAGQHQGAQVRVRVDVGDGPGIRHRSPPEVQASIRALILYSPAATNASTRSARSVRYTAAR